MSEQHTQYPESPLSAEEKVRLIRRIPCCDLTEKWQHGFQIDISREFDGIDEIRLYDAESTRLQFFMPEEAAGSSWLYEQLEVFDWFYSDNKWEHLQALKDLRNCTNVLEVGAARGAFVKAARERGIATKGIEINRSAVKAAQQSGLPVESTELASLANDEKEAFDGICCFQVLEHIAAPKQFLNVLITLLQPGGLLVLSVPNADSFLKHQENLLDMPPHHMTRWRVDTFRSMEKLFPLALEKVRLEPLQSYHVKTYLETYAHLFARTGSKMRYLVNHTTIGLHLKLLKVLGARHFSKAKACM